MDVERPTAGGMLPPFARVPRRSARELAVAAVTHPTARTVAMVALLFLVAVVGWGNVDETTAPRLPLGIGRLTWWELAPVFLVSEVFVLHVQVKREARVVSLSDLPLVVGLFFLSPLGLLAARAAGTVVAYVVWRRQHPLKLAFNTAQLMVEVLIAVVLFRDALGPPQVSVRAWGAALLATMAASALTAMLVTVVIALNEGRSRLAELGSAARSGAVTAAAVTVAGLVAVSALAYDLANVVLLVVVTGATFYAFRAYANLSVRHLSLERLYQFTRVVTSSPEMEEVLHTLLMQAKELLRAEYSEVLFLGSGNGDPGVRVSLDRHGALTRAPVSDADGDAAVIARISGTASPLLARRGGREPLTNAWLAARRFREAVAAPLHGDVGTTGILTVADRLGDLLTFEPDDIRMLETVANHASVALENGRLVEQLRHEALHDTLTGLPNRALLHRTMRHHLELLEAGATAGFAVLLMDLDGFKEVNDTLGHHQGDELLQEIATRLSDVCRPSGFVARLGGDEFAMVLPDLGEGDDALLAGQRILGVFEQPVTVGSTDVQVGGSLGIALAPRHGTDGNGLLKRADLAMYAAKEQGRGATLYDPALDTLSPQRLALVGELRTALTAGDQLLVFLQPKVHIATGVVVGAEALVRWQHPVHGLLGPEDFVPMAERSGLIRPLTSAVLRVAVSSAARWRRLGLACSVAVNLSPRSLLDADLVEEVAALLKATDLPADRLVLEITESSVMSDPERTMAVLDAIAALGVRLSVDDFGTGYSSLSYLKRLPVHEVKIDKSFVTDLLRAGDDDDAAIVRSIVTLGASLKLDVVAEGVEDEGVWSALATMGCTMLQGFALARPMPEEDFLDWLSGYVAPVLEPRTAAVPAPRGVEVPGRW